MKLERKSDHIKVLESDSASLSKSSGLQCIHCKERQYMIQKQGDINNAFCTNCGNLTPLRTIKHSRGLAAPSMQEPTTIVQPTEKGQIKKGSQRIPKSINTKTNNKEEYSAEKYLTDRGYTIIDSQYVEPT